MKIKKQEWVEIKQALGEKASMLAKTIGNVHGIPSFFYCSRIPRLIRYPFVFHFSPVPCEQKEFKKTDCICLFYDGAYYELHVHKPGRCPIKKRKKGK